MSVVDIILFVASSSKICEALLKFIKTSEIPARIVRLDSEEIRKAVCNGKYFKITVVPTMVVVYEDDNIQLYEGMEKIVKWIKLLLQAQKEPKPEPEQYQPEPMIKEQKQELIGKKEQNIQEIEVITRIPNEDEPEEIAEPVMVEQKKKKGRKGKKKILTFEDDKIASWFMIMFPQ